MMDSSIERLQESLLDFSNKTKEWQEWRELFLFIQLVRQNSEKKQLEDARYQSSLNEAERIAIENVKRMRETGMTIYREIERQLEEMIPEDFEKVEVDK